MSNFYYRQSIHLATLALLANEKAVRPGFIAWIDGYGLYSAAPAGSFGIADGYHIIDGRDGVQWADESIVIHPSLQIEIDRAIAAENEIKLTLDGYVVPDDLDGYATTLELQGETERAVAVENEIKLALDGYGIPVNLDGYATTLELQLVENEIKLALDGYATTGALQGETDRAVGVEQEIKNALDGYLVSSDLDGYATTLELQGEIDRAIAVENEIKNVLDGYGSTGISGEATLVDGYILVSLPKAIPIGSTILFSRKTPIDFIGDISILYQNTDEFVLVSSSKYDQSVISWLINGVVSSSLVSSVGLNLDGYATKISLQDEVDRAVAVENEIKIALDGYVVPADLDGYTTKSYVDGYISNYTTKAYVDGYFSNYTTSIGFISNPWGDFSDGDVTFAAATTTTLTRDMHYRYVSFAHATTAKVDTKGWWIYAETLDMNNLATGGGIYCIGANGGNYQSTGHFGGADKTIVRSAKGGDGALVVSSVNGTRNGCPGWDSSGWGGLGGDSGDSGWISYGGLVGGFPYRNLPMILGQHILSGGGGAGASSAATSAYNGTGGGQGSPGIRICCQHLILPTQAAVGCIKTTGGNGGAGDIGGTSDAGTGGGGGGGAIVIVCQTLTNTRASFALSIGGNAGVHYVESSRGKGGYGGHICLYVVGTDTWYLAGPTANSTVTGGTTSLTV